MKMRTQEALEKEKENEIAMQKYNEYKKLVRARIVPPMDNSSRVSD